MEQLFNALRYGAIGLGLALALLAFFLLRSELRRQAQERDARPIYVFMIFSLVIASLGFYAEWKKNVCYDIAELGATLGQLQQAHMNGRTAIEGANGTISQSPIAFAAIHGALTSWLTQSDPAVSSQIERAKEVVRHHAAVCKM
jgi:hypothetical protein